jgi:hypothetical protein
MRSFDNDIAFGECLRPDERNIPQKKSVRESKETS